MMSVVSNSSFRRVVQTGSTWVDAALDAVFPLHCILCSRAGGSPAEPLCAACAAWVEQASGRAYCPRCGATVAPHAGDDPACPTCARHGRFAFDSVTRVGAYRNGMRSLLTAFKFGGREELDAYFARRLARVIARLDIYDDIDALVPVPTCWTHRLRRPFYPAEVVGRFAARLCGIPYAPLLVRRRGPHQIGLSFTARQHNVRGRFHIARGCSAPGARLLLVDDVMTTGATVGECTRVLRKAGAQEVHVAVLARAGDDAVTLRHV